jgi:hypothetical protein
MNTRYLVGIGESDAVEINTLKLIDARSEEEACLIYRKHVLARDELHRRSICSKGINAGFAAQFWFANKREDFHYQETGMVSVTDEVFRERVTAYFVSRPELGDAYLDYYFSDENVTAGDLPQEIFEYIALKDMQFSTVTAIRFGDIDIVTEDLQARSEGKRRLG